MATDKRKRAPPKHLDDYSSGAGAPKRTEDHGEAATRRDDRGAVSVRTNGGAASKSTAGDSGVRADDNGVAPMRTDDRSAVLNSADDAASKRTADDRAGNGGGGGGGDGGGGSAASNKRTADDRGAAAKRTDGSVAASAPKHTDSTGLKRAGKSATAAIQPCAECPHVKDPQHKCTAECHRAAYERRDHERAQAVEERERRVHEDELLRDRDSRTKYSAAANAYLHGLSKDLEQVGLTGDFISKSVTAHARAGLLLPPKGSKKAWYWLCFMRQAQSQTQEARNVVSDVYCIFCGDVMNGASSNNSALERHLHTPARHPARLVDIVRPYFENKMDPTSNPATTTTSQSGKMSKSSTPSAASSAMRQATLVFASGRAAPATRAEKERSDQKVITLWL